MLIGAATAALVYVPFVARDPDAFMTATRAEAHVVSAATPETVWLLASHEKTVHVSGFPTLTFHEVAHWVPPASHSLIVLIATSARPTPVAPRHARGRSRSHCWRCSSFSAAFSTLSTRAISTFRSCSRFSRGRCPLGSHDGWASPARWPAAVSLALTFDVLQAHGVNEWLIDSVYLGWSGAVGWYLLGELNLVRRPALMARPPASLRYGETP